MIQTQSVVTRLELPRYFLRLGAMGFGDAVAVALITPGPVVITTGFIGHLVAGLAAALAGLAIRG